MRALPRLGELYPGICLTAEEKARKHFLLILSINSIQHRLLEGLSQSRHSLQFIKTEGSLPWTQEPVGNPDPEVMSSGRTNNAALYCPTRLDL